MEYQYNEKQVRIRQQFYDDRGKWKWNDTWATILALNSDIMSAYSTMSSVPHKKGKLSLKVKELIYVAIDNAITHYYTPGMISHLRHGMNDLGATKEELMEVFAITSTIGTPTYTTGVPILREALRQRGTDISAQKLTDRQEELKERWISENGFWSYDMDSILKMDTEMFEGYMDYVAASANGALDQKTRELVYIAVNASPTALNTFGMELHIQKALDLGVTADEIMEVFELVACLGIHSVTVGIPAVNEVLREREEKVNDKGD